MTSTKIIAWVIMVVGFSIIGVIPESDRTDYIETVLWVIATLYGIKNGQGYFRKKSPKVMEDESDI